MMDLDWCPFSARKSWSSKAYAHLLRNLVLASSAYVYKPPGKAKSKEKYPEVGRSKGQEGCEVNVYFNIVEGQGILKTGPLYVNLV